MEPVEERLANVSLSSGATNGDATKHGLFSSSSELEEKEKFMVLIQKARQNAEAGNIARALRLNRRALAINYSEKLERRIKKMEAFLDEEDDANEEDGNKNMGTLGEGFLLHKSMCKKLYSHQKEGVLWMWSLHNKGKGGILADDMGLGKTIQVIGFLAGMFDMEKVKSVLIVLTLSLMPVWCNEFSKWAPGIDICQFHGGSKKEKERALHRVRTRGGVLLTTYGHIVTQHEMLASRHGREFLWDYIILDEGHKIKNQTKTSKAIHGIPAKMRLILTGTPVQNNLKELWALFDYVQQGALLGTLRTFKMEFEAPITRARERDASAVARRLGEEMSETLRSIIQPYFLRRTKADVNTLEGQEASDDVAQMPSLTRKNDLVIWLFLSDVQKKIYEDFSKLDDIKQLLMTKKSPLVALTVLKKICDHPRLLSTRACLQLGLDGEHFDEEELEKASSYESAANQIDKIADEVLIEESGKMKVLVDLLNSFKAEGRKTLVFSQSRKLLDIIEKILRNRGHKVARLDGTITQISEREEIVSKFQRDDSYSVFLLTIQVGGVGLTITAADRVVIYDPSWNPAVDAQAVDRAYRIGQENNVVVYRLITCGTVEEKIYRRQVFKDSITQQTTGNSKNPYRYFTKMELRELFQLDDPYFSKTQRQLQDMHSTQRITDTDLDRHLAFLHSLDIFGISDHDLMFKQTDVRDDEMNESCEIGERHMDANFIQAKVQQAQSLIAQESVNNFTYEQRSKGTWTASSNGFGIPLPNTNNGTAGAHLVPSSDQAFPTEPVVMDLTSDDELASENTENMIDDNIEVDDSPSKLASFLEKRSEKDRRALQPLSPEEVKQRSPQVVTCKKDGLIVKEELFISPDGKRPLVGLSRDFSCEEHSFSRGNESFKFESPVKPSDLVARSFQKNLFSSPSNSPSKNSPSKGKISSPSRFNEMVMREALAEKSILHCSSPRSEASSSSEHVILVEESSDEDCYDSPVLEEAKVSSSSPSSACRKLSFIVPNSADNSVVDTSLNRMPDLSSSACVEDSAQFSDQELGDEEDYSETEVKEEDNNDEEKWEVHNESKDGMDVTDGENIYEDKSDNEQYVQENSVQENDIQETGDKENNVQESGDKRNGDENSSNGSKSHEKENNVQDNDEDENIEREVSDGENGEADNEEEIFQDLVTVARCLYKSKSYEESLQYVERALTIYQEPGLQEMAHKIRRRIEQNSSS